MTRIIGTLLILLFVGCASEETATITEGEQSLIEIKKAIVAIIGEPKHVSENQREFTSKFFNKDPNLNVDPEKAKVRFYTVMAIQGPRRPYDIEIRAFVEQRVGKEYEEVGEDSDVAKKLAQQLKDRLNQSREGRNLIDDFRAF